MKHFLFCIAMLLFFPVSGQIWKYPFAPFEYKYEADTLRKGKRSVTICSVMQDYMDCGYTEYDASGKKIRDTEYSNCEDTITYEYEEPGNPNWTRAISSGGVIITRSFEHDSHGNVTRMTTTRKGIPNTVTCTYNEAGQPLKFGYNDSNCTIYAYEAGRIATVTYFKENRLAEKIRISFSGDTITYIDCYYDETGRQYPGERVRGIVRNGRLEALYTDYNWFTEESDWGPDNWTKAESSFMRVDYTANGDWEGYWEVMSNGNEGGIKGYCNERGDVIKQEIFSGSHHHANIYITYEYYE